MTAQTEKRDPAILTHLARPWPQRPSRLCPARVWQRARLSEILSYTAVQMAERRDASTKGRMATTEIVIAGGATEADRPPLEWWLEPAAEGWHVAGVLGERRAGGTYHDTAATGARVQVRMSAPWFGAEDGTRAIAGARDRLTAALRNVWRDRGVHLMGTPGRTGLDLLHRALPEGHDYAPLDADARAALWGTGIGDQRIGSAAGYGQGRMQFCAPAGLDVAPDGLWVYDLAWAYAACTRRVPVAPFLRDQGLALDFIPYRPGYYRCDWTIPRGWHGMGLLPLPILVQGEPRTGWPAAPGAEGESWVSGDELRLALAAGWRVAIRERILGADPNGLGQAGDPLRRWTERLRHLRAEASDRHDTLLRGALRNMLNQGIGHLWRRDTEQLHRIPYRAGWQLPHGAYAPAFLPSLRAPAVIEYRTRRPLAKEMLCYQRPEWAASVWGQCRALIASLALSVPRSQLVAFRTDSLVLTAPHPAWDVGAAQVGHMRLKRLIPGPVAIPRDEESWRELVDEADDDESLDAAEGEMEEAD